MTIAANDNPAALIAGLERLARAEDNRAVGCSGRLLEDIQADAHLLRTAAALLSEWRWRPMSEAPRKDGDAILAMTGETAYTPANTPVVVRVKTYPGNDRITFNTFADALLPEELRGWIPLSALPPLPSAPQKE